MDIYIYVDMYIYIYIYHNLEYLYEQPENSYNDYDL